LVEDSALLWQVTIPTSNACIVGVDPDVSGALAVIKSEDQGAPAEVLEWFYNPVQVNPPFSNFWMMLKKRMMWSRWVAYRGLGIAIQEEIRDFLGVRRMFMVEASECEKQSFTFQCAMDGIHVFWGWLVTILPCDFIS
jgi:hypothetical protein